MSASGPESLPPSFPSVPPTVSGPVVDETFLPPPTLVSIPDYRVLALLGRGGMGVVYKAEHLRGQRVVALKLMLGGPLADAEERRRFRTEAEAAARLQHPNVVPVYDIGEWHPDAGPSVPYFSMEFCPGGSLAGRLDGTPWLPTDAARLVEALAQGLHAAHGKGVVHRDLKPANVLLAEGGTPKVADFGLARKLDERVGLTRTQAILGTPEYMAPEQASGHARDAGPAADIYALGVVLYELLTGRTPFKGATIMDTLDQVRSQEAVPPTRLQAKVPPDLETVCLKCLHKEPQNRYPSAGDLADDLSRFLKGESIRARPVSRCEKAWRWARRNPAVASLSLLVVLLTVLGLGLVLWQWDEAVRQREEARVARDRANELTGKEKEARSLAETRAIAAKKASAAAEASARAEREQRQRAERSQYQRYFALALQAFRDSERATEPATLAPGQLSPREKHRQRAEALLDECGQAYRGWEWHWLKGRFRQRRLAYRRLDLSLPQGSFLRPGMFDSQSVSVAVSGDGHTLAYLWNGSPRVVQNPGGKQRWVAESDVKEAGSLALSSNGSRLAVLNKDGSALVWEFPGGTRRSLRLGGRAFAERLAFTPDGKYLVASRFRDVVVWDMETDKETACVKSESIPDIFVVSPNGSKLAIAYRGVVSIRELPSGEEIRSLRLTGDHFPVRDLAWNSSGTILAGTLLGEGTTRLWDIATGKERVLRTRSFPRYLAFSPGGELAVAHQTGNITLWSPSDGTRLRTLEPQPLAEPRLRGDCVGVGFRASGTQLVSFHLGGTVHNWYGLGCEPLVCVKESAIFSALRFLDDSPTFAARLTSARNTRGEVHVWDARTGTSLFPGKEFPRLPAAAEATSPDGRYLAKATGPDVRVTDQAGQEIAHVSLPRETQVLALSRGAKLLAAVNPGSRPGDPGEVFVWEPGKEYVTLVLRGHAGPVFALAFSPDGSRLASGASVGAKGAGRFEDKVKFSGGEIKLWDTTTGTELLTLIRHTREVRSLAFSADGTLLASGGADGRAYVWDATPGPELLSRPGAHPAFSPAGKYLIANDERAIRTWELHTGEEVKTVPATGRVVSSPDGRQTAFVSLRQIERPRYTDIGFQHDVTVRDNASRKIVFAGRKLGGEASSCAFTPDGRQLMWCAAVRRSESEWGQTLDNVFTILDLSSGRSVAHELRRSGHLNRICFDRTAKRVGVSSEGGQSVFVLAGTGKEEIRLRQIPGAVTDLCFHPDGKHLLTAHGRWDPRDENYNHYGWEGILAEEAARTTSMVGWMSSVGLSRLFAPRLLAGGGDWWNAHPIRNAIARRHTGKVIVWNLATAKRVRAFKGTTERFTSVAVSRDGAHVVAGDWKGALTAWDWETGREVLAVPTRCRPITHLAFHPRGDQLVSGSSDLVQLWDWKRLLAEQSPAAP